MFLRSRMGDVSHERLVRAGGAGAGALAASCRLQLPCCRAHHTLRHRTNEV